MTFTTEITVDVEVEVLDATRGTPGRYGDQPEACSPAEQEMVEFRVWLCRDTVRIDISTALPPAVGEALGAEVFERLEDAAAEP
jgi:hypothetical protein